MERYFINYTNADVTIEDLGLTITANSSANLIIPGILNFMDISNSNDLLELLGQGTDKYQISEGGVFYDTAEGIRLITQITARPRVTDEQGIPYAYNTARPLNTSLYFSGRSDTSEVGKGELFCFDIPASAGEYNYDTTYNETVWAKDGWIAYENAPWGATLSVQGVHPYYGVIYQFINNVPIYGTNHSGICFESDARGQLPQGIVFRVHITNATEGSAGFKVWGMFKMYREHTV